jgi:F0F1-type ATP synthase alpha subunit
MNLEQDTVGAALFGDTDLIREGDTVKATGRILEVPVGMEMLGRVVDPLGVALDGGPAIRASSSRKVDIVAPEAEPEPEESVASHVVATAESESEVTSPAPKKAARPSVKKTPKAA